MRKLITITRLEDKFGYSTGLKDPHIELVSEYVDVLDVIDPYALIRGTQETVFSVNVGSNATDIAANEILCKDYGAVWYRKPNRPPKEDFPFNNAEYNHYAWSAYESAVSNLYVELETLKWMSPYYDLLRSSNKMLQMRKAREAGMRLPPTLVTNNPVEARHFIDLHKEVIQKTLSNHNVIVDGKVLLPFTAVAKKDQDFTALPFTPTIFQKRVHKAFELRITVAGDKVFPAVVRPAAVGQDYDVDWRIAAHEENCNFESFGHLPREIHDGCITILKNLGLCFGAFDFIVDKKGNYWFLEVNCNGQWAFIEQETNMPIAKAIADTLFN